MAKKAKSGSVKLPKKIGQMKVPKKVRKAGEALLDKANSPEGRRAIAAGVSLLATAALSGSSRQTGEAAKDAAKKGKAKAEEGVDTATEAGKHFAQAIGTAALAAFTKAFEKPTKH